MSRIDSARIAARKAEDAQKAAKWDEPRTKGCACASDAFFPSLTACLQPPQLGRAVSFNPADPFAMPKSLRRLMKPALPWSLLVCGISVTEQSHRIQKTDQRNQTRLSRKSTSIGRHKPPNIFTHTESRPSLQLVAYKAACGFLWQLERFLSNNQPSTRRIQDIFYLFRLLYLKEFCAYLLQLWTFLPPLICACSRESKCIHLNYGRLRGSYLRRLSFYLRKFRIAAAVFVGIISFLNITLICR